MGNIVNKISLKMNEFHLEVSNPDPKILCWSKFSSIYFEFACLLCKSKLFQQKVFVEKMSKNTNVKFGRNAVQKTDTKDG